MNFISLFTFFYSIKNTLSYITVNRECAYCCPKNIRKWTTYLGKSHRVLRLLHYNDSRQKNKQKILILEDFK